MCVCIYERERLIFFPSSLLRALVTLNNVLPQNQFSKDEIGGTDADNGGPLRSGWCL